MSKAPAIQPRTLTQVAHSLGVTTYRATEPIERTVERIRRLAILLQDKMTEVVVACDALPDDADRCLSSLISIANHAGYSNTISANVADLMAECGRIDATIDAWVRAQ